MRLGLRMWKTAAFLQSFTYLVRPRRWEIWYHNGAFSYRLVLMGWTGWGRQESKQHSSQWILLPV